MRRAFSRPCAAVTLPGTTVRARTSSSGELRASMIASASSVPGSVSMMTLRPVAAAESTRNRRTKRTVRRRKFASIGTRGDEAKEKQKWTSEQVRWANLRIFTPTHKIKRRVVLGLPGCQGKSRVLENSLWKDCANRERTLPKRDFLQLERVFCGFGEHLQSFVPNWEDWPTMGIPWE